MTETEATAAAATTNSRSAASTELDGFYFSTIMANGITHRVASTVPDLLTRAKHGGNEEKRDQENTVLVMFLHGFPGKLWNQPRACDPCCISHSAFSNLLCHLVIRIMVFMASSIASPKRPQNLFGSGT